MLDIVKNIELYGVYKVQKYKFKNKLIIKQ